MAFLTAAWDTLAELAPWLWLGMAIAGLVHVLLPPGFVHRQLQGTWGVVKAVLLGVPLPLCSCGVIPAGLGLKKDGASDGAAVGFLISTPQTGVDAILVSGAMLGWPFALFKVGAAAVTGVVGGLWVGSRTAAAAPEVSVDHAPRGAAWRRALGHAFEILDMLWGWLVVGVLISAAVTTWLPPAALSGLADWGALAGIAVLAVSVPLYVCATASVPIAAALVAGGLPLGAALVFLMAGPATNAATIAAVRGAFGTRVLVRYLATIIVGSLLAGGLFDQVLASGLVGEHAHHHEHGHGWVTLASTVAMALALAAFAVRDGVAGLQRLSRPATGSGATTELVLQVEGLTCGGCVKKLRGALEGVDGVEGTEVALGVGAPSVAKIRGKMSEAATRDAVAALGYRVV